MSNNSQFKLKKVKKPALYNYMSIKYIDSAITKGIHASFIDNMNDPYEYFLIANPKEYVVCCFTTSLNAKLMWSHYGDKHCGCVVKYKLSSDFFNEDYIIKKVNYQSLFKPYNCKKIESIIDRLYTKDKKWIQEKEYRAVAHISDLNKNLWNVEEIKEKDELVVKHYYLKLDVERIVFGCNSHLYENEYKKALKFIKEYNDIVSINKKIDVKKMKMDTEKYRFIYDETFNYENELEKLQN